MLLTRWLLNIAIFCKTNTYIPYGINGIFLIKKYTKYGVNFSLCCTHPYKYKHMYCHNTGVTSNLIKHVWEHKTHAVEGFNQKYTVTLLVHYELHEDLVTAIAREKQIKAGSKAKKIGLIAQLNPEWNDPHAKII